MFLRDTRTRSACVSGEEERFSLTHASSRQLGNRIDFLALPLLAATTLHASAFDVSMLRILQTLAYLLLGLQVGAWCDRMRNRPILIVADLGRAVAYATVPIAAAFNALTLWQVYIVVAVAGVLGVFFEVAHQTYLPRLVEREDLTEGNARLQANISVAAVAGPSAAGFLVQFFSAPGAVAANAVSFLWSASWLKGIRTREPRLVRAARVPVRRDIADGLRYLRRQPILSTFAITATLVSLFQSMQIVVGVLFLLRDVGLSPGAIGLVSTTGLVGAVLGALSARRLGTWAGEARMIRLAALPFASGYPMLPLTGSGWQLVWYPLGTFLASFAITVMNVLQVSFQQATTPEGLRGRLNATMKFLIFGVAPLGSLLGGVLATSTGLRTTLWIAAAGLMFSMVFLVFSPLRRMRDLPAGRLVSGSTRP
ncbi:MFS transporter [Amycolatopsis taiwanensis]|uniref:MFS transporter n=1 Tax=Amycolatopsis taiwanensis TaxID=342230 RepID=A0A9W6QWS2_9PSEU|nr:MFS transporter [Amycolatopsis taiwanensis]GLY63868.1 MFS transporter [Amycolatopsis taiwanensis]